MSISRNSFTRRELGMILVLMIIQISHMIDFVVLMPLGPRLTKIFSITSQQFGWLVSCYTIAAALSAFLLSTLMDRYDRKKSILAIYFFFILGTLFCALANSYSTLFMARIFAGLFGGLLSGQALAIVGDKVAPERRGRATGLLVSGFSIASIAGVPLGLQLAEWFGWNAPFFFVVGLSSLAFVLGFYYLPLVSDHLTKEKKPTVMPWMQFGIFLMQRETRSALLMCGLLMLANFTVVPYLALYLTGNFGVLQSQLPWMYFLGGAAALLGVNFIGGWSERFSKHRVCKYVSIISLLPILFITHLYSLCVAIGFDSKKVPLFVIFSITSFYMLTASGRNVPGIALANSSVPPERRGSFMTLNNGFQYFCSGLGSGFAGLLLTTTSDGVILGFPASGMIAVLLVLASMYFSRGVHSKY